MSKNMLKVIEITFGGTFFSLYFDDFEQIHWDFNGFEQSVIICAFGQNMRKRVLRFPFSP